MLNIINDLLDLARHRSRTASTLRRDPADLIQVVNRYARRRQDAQPCRRSAASSPICMCRMPESSRRHRMEMGNATAADPNAQPSG